MRLVLLLAAALARAAGPEPGVLRVCDDVAAPLTLNPLREFSEKNHTIVQQIFDGLVRFDPQGRIEPALAVSWKRLDDLTVEFRLREGVKFHDGEAFDSAAVKFSLERFADSNSGYPGAGFLGSIESVKVAGPHKIVLRTRYPDGLLLNRLAGLVSILPPRDYARRGESSFSKHPNGTGAYKYSGQTGRGGVLLEANSEYWDGVPKYSKLAFEFLPLPEQISSLLSGEVDIVTELPGTETLKVMRSGRARVVKKETFYTIGASVNANSGPLSDLRVRRAINHAIDRDALVRYDLLGNGRPLASLTMPGEIGHDPTLKPYRYDPPLARKLLAGAGYAKGLTLDVVVKEQGERALKIIAAQLAKVGIRLNPHRTNDASVIRDIASRRWDLTFGGCPDPLAHSFFIQFLFLSSSSPYSILKDQEFDARLAAMVATLDPGAQHAAGMEVDRYVHDQALGLFTYQRIKTHGVSDQVDFVPSVTGMPHFRLTSPKR